MYDDIEKGEWRVDEKEMRSSIRGRITVINGISLWQSKGFQGAE